MKRIIKIFSVLALTLFVAPFSLAQLTPSSDKNSCIPCKELENLVLPDVVVSEAIQLEEPVPHCKISGTIGKEINFELLLPKDWNSRFVMGGGGGFVGSVQNTASSSINDGYATAGTDTGHEGSGIQAGWALNNMERQVNFGHLAVHRTAVVSKEIIRQFYCSGSEYSYFIGCSRGWTGIDGSTTIPR